MPIKIIGLYLKPLGDIIHFFPSTFSTINMPFSRFIAKCFDESAIKPADAQDLLTSLQGLKLSPALVMRSEWLSQWVAGWFYSP